SWVSSFPGPVRQKGCKNLAFVRGHENIVGGHALRKNRQLALNLDDAAVRPTSAASILEHLLLDNSRSEPKFAADTTQLPPGCQRSIRGLVAPLGREHVRQWQ